MAAKQVENLISSSSSYLCYYKPCHHIYATVSPGIISTSLIKMDNAREYVEGKDAKEREENREKIMKRSRQWVSRFLINANGSGVDVVVFTEYRRL
jgi:hypothetical protein